MMRMLVARKAGEDAMPPRGRSSEPGAERSELFLVRSVGRRTRDVGTRRDRALFEARGGSRALISSVQTTHVDSYT